MNWMKISWTNEISNDGWHFMLKDTGEVKMHARSRSQKKKKFWRGYNQIIIPPQYNER